MDIQNVIVIFIVGSAVAYVGVKFFRKKSSSKSKSDCGSSDGCSSCPLKDSSNCS